MILSGQTIRNLRIVTPCIAQVRFAGVTAGLGHAGYDLRVAEGHCLVQHQFQLASSLEHFSLPTNVMGIVHDKSSWARRGLSVLNTVLEPGWKGYLTIELVYHGYDPLEIAMGAGIAQVVFHFLDREATFPYEGKYQDQKAGPQPAILV